MWDLSMLPAALTTGPLFIPVLVLAPMVGGEAAVMTLAFLAYGKGHALFTVIVFSFLGMILLDSFWFMLIRSPLASRFGKRMKSSEKYEALEARIRAIAQNRHVLILIISKVLVGTRILTLLYIGSTGLPYLRFLIYNGAATFVWATILSAGGWFAAFGSYNIWALHHDLRFVATFLVLLAGTLALGLGMLRTQLKG